MQRMLRNKLVTCMVVVAALVVAVAFAGDVIVKPDEIQFDNLRMYKSGNDIVFRNTVSDGDLYFKVLDSGELGDAFWIDASDQCHAYFYHDVSVADDVIVNDDLTADTVTAGYDVFANDDLVASDDIACNDDIFAGGKIDSNGGYDPPYVLYDQQSRDEVIDRVKKEVPPEKQGGAALFFNRDTKRLETYVASEGKFYDLKGSLIYTLQKVVAPVTQYETAYYLEPSTGLVKTRQKEVSYKYRVREGFELKGKTGRFIDKRTGGEATREAALEWCVENERVYHDMAGNVLRTEPKEEDAQYVVEYRFNSHTGDVKVRRNAIHDRHALKEGYGLDKTTGKFVDTNTGGIVAKEQAVQLIKASEIAERYKNRGN